MQVLLWVRALLAALYLTVCGVLAVHGVFIHASIKNSSAGLLRGLALLLRVISIRGAAFAALLLGVLVWFLLQFLQGRFLRLCCSSPAKGVSLLCRRAAFRRSLRPLVSVRPAADDRGADSVRRFSWVAGRVCCCGCWGPSEGPRAAWRRISGTGRGLPRGIRGGAVKNRGYFEKVSGLNFPADFRGLP